MARPRGTTSIPPERRYESYLENIRAGKASDHYIKEAQRLLTQHKDRFPHRALDEAICEGCGVEIKNCEETIALGLGPYEVGKYNKRIIQLTDRLERATERLKSYEQTEKKAEQG